MTNTCDYCGKDYPEGENCSCEQAVEKRKLEEVELLLEGAIAESAEDLREATLPPLNLDLPNAEEKAAAVEPLIAPSDIIAPVQPPVSNLGYGQPPQGQPVQPPASYVGYGQPVQGQPVQPPASNLGYGQPPQGQPVQPPVSYVGQGQPLQGQPNVMYNQQGQPVQVQVQPQPQAQPIMYNEQGQPIYGQVQQPQGPSQVSVAANSILAILTDFIKDPIAAVKSDKISINNGIILLCINLAAYILYMIFYGGRVTGGGIGFFSAVIYPILGVGLSFGSLFGLLLLGCKLFGNKTTTAKTIFGIVSMVSIPVSAGYLVKTVSALLFGGIFSLHNGLVSIVDLVVIITLVILIERALEGNIKNNFHRILTIAVSVAVYNFLFGAITNISLMIMYGRGMSSGFGNMFR